MEKLLGLTKGKLRLPILQFLDFICTSLAYWLIVYRLPLARPAITTTMLWTSYALLIACSVFGRMLMKVDLQVWRYAEARAYLRLLLGDLIAGLLFLLIDRVLLAHHLSFAVIVAAFSVGVLAKLSARFFYQALRRRPFFSGKKSVTASNNKINVAIVGAGELGVLLARELQANKSARYHPYCFFDNDPRKIGTSIEGIPVMGPDNVVVGRVNSMPIQDIIIALPNMTAEAQKQVFETYKHTNCRVMLYDYPIRQGETSEERRTIREINIEDLLFRDVVSLDQNEVVGAYRDSVVLVTGAGGSIGSELCRQIARIGPRLLVLLDIYENGVYDIQQELKRRHGSSVNTRTIIANICDAARMREVFDHYKPDIVFHAAAHKHVPLMENNCAEAVTNNVLGTVNVVEAAEHAKVRRFVMISTDKAVNPTNVMGATKRLCEMVILSRKDSDTDFVAVRFGNVLGSNGSVVPLFKQQIAEGGPVTITDKRIIRYFMAIPEAAQLVLRTGSLGAKGELYVLDMGKPVRILDLAESMISLSGFVPYEEIDIKEIGLRPGEKLYEELLIKTDNCIKTRDKRIFIEREQEISRKELDGLIATLRHGLDQDSSDEAVRKLMMDCVPSYQTAEVVNAKAADAKEFRELEPHPLSEPSLAPGIPG